MQCFEFANFQSCTLSCLQALNRAGTADSCSATEKIDVLRINTAIFSVALQLALQSAVQSALSASCQWHDIVTTAQATVVCMRERGHTYVGIGALPCPLSLIIQLP